MSILFLDIDGVLNSTPKDRDPKAWFKREADFEPDLVARLNRVLKATRCDVVISSSWRYLVRNVMMTPAGFERLLNSHGVRLHGTLLGVTGPDVTGEDDERGRQIHEWRQDRFSESYQTNYAIVDDMQGGFEGMPIVRTAGAEGLSDANVEQLIELLGERK